MFPAYISGNREESFVIPYLSVSAISFCSRRQGISMNKHRKCYENLFCLFNIHIHFFLHGRNNRYKFLGIYHFKQAVFNYNYRSKQKAEQIRFFNRKTDIIPPNSKHYIFLCFWNVHQIFRMIVTCFCKQLFLILQSLQNGT